MLIEGMTSKRSPRTLFTLTQARISCIEFGIANRSNINRQNGFGMRFVFFPLRAYPLRLLAGDVLVARDFDGQEIYYHKRSSRWETWGFALEILGLLLFR